MRAERVHQTACERKQLPVAGDVHLLSQRTGEQWREERMGNERRQRREREDEEKTVEGEEERGDTVASKACQSVLSAPADKTNLSEYSFTSNAMHLKNSIFWPDIGTLTWCHLQVQVGAAALLREVKPHCRNVSFFSPHVFSWFSSHVPKHESSELPIGINMSVNPWKTSLRLYLTLKPLIQVC